MLVDRAYLFQDGMLLMPADASKVSEDGFSLEVPCDATSLFSIQPSVISSLSSNEPPLLIGDVPSDYVIPLNWRRVPVRHLVSVTKKDAAFRLMRAFHIAQWRRESVYCGSCGGKNVDSETETTRVCPQCGRTEYPRITPAVIVLITNDKDEVLLAHNKRFKPGLYSLIAGFNEAGETLEKTVSREVLEETGVRIKDIRYKLSQPWAFPYSLMTGWTAHYAGGQVRADGVEIEDVRWFPRDRLPELPSQGSLASVLIGWWRDGYPKDRL